MTLLLPPERAEEESVILERVSRGESVHHFDTVRVRKDGKKIDVSVTISPVVDSRGAILGASKIARDITEQKKQQELAQRQAQLLDQANVTPAGDRVTLRMSLSDAQMTSLIQHNTFALKM